MRFLLIALVVMLTSEVHADVVLLKTGARIKNCRIVEESKSKVVLRTLEGRMDVPRSVISEIKKSRSVFDAYDEKLAAVPEDDAEALWELVEWCLEKGGFREEARSNTSRVVELDPEHFDARHALGFARKGKEWVKLEPMNLAIEFSEDHELASKVRKRLEGLFAERDDVKLLEELDEGGEDQGTLVASISTSHKDATEFYGRNFGSASAVVIISLEMKGPVAEKRSFKLKISGQAPAKIPGAANHTINDAFAKNTGEIHKLFDEVLGSRIEAVEPKKKSKKKKKRSRRKKRG